MFVLGIFVIKKNLIIVGWNKRPSFVAKAATLTLLHHNVTLRERY